MLGFKSCCMAILSAFVLNLEYTRRFSMLWLKSYDQWDMGIPEMWPLRNSWLFFSICQSQAYPYVMLESDSSMQMEQFPSGYFNHRWQQSNDQRTGTSEKWPSSSHLNHFTTDMFDVQLPMILSLPGSMIMANYGLSSKDALEPLMVVIYTSSHPLLSKVSIC